MTNQNDYQPAGDRTEAAIRTIAAALQAQTGFFSRLRDDHVDAKRAAAVITTLGEDPHDVVTVIARFGQLADTDRWVIVQEAIEAAEAEYIALAGRWFRVLAEALGGYDEPATGVEPALEARWNAVGNSAVDALERFKVYAVQWENLRAQIINAPVNRDDGAIEAIRDLAAYAVRLAQNSVKDMTDRVHVAEYTIRG